MAGNDQRTPEEARFESLLARGLSREKAARIVAAEAGDEPELYDDWTDEELHDRMLELGIETLPGIGREEMIATLRARRLSPDDD